jgi:1-acyl-sn-glycerol-3-phosphate acyltransferase
LVFRGSITLGLVGILFILTDLAQRTIVAGLVRIRPAARERILTRWKRFLAAATLGTVRWSGGATIQESPPIPGGPGVLIVMNHQSLLDIPLAVRAVTEGYPRFVTRRRYARGIPLVSHMLRLYDHPLVDPGHGSAEQLHSLRRVAATSLHPLMIFPEGTRTRDGSIGPFRRAGLAAILTARDWDVYLLVADGMWRCARIHDFIHNIGSVETRISCVGPIRYPGTPAGVDSFIADLRERMCSQLSQLRNSPQTVPSVG